VRAPAPSKTTAITSTQRTRGGWSTSEAAAWPWTVQRDVVGTSAAEGRRDRGRGEFGRPLRGHTSRSLSSRLPGIALAAKPLAVRPKANRLLHQRH
jgi:hypothetical protein